MSPSRIGPLIIVALLVSCDGSGSTAPDPTEPVIEIGFDRSVLDLGAAASGTVTLTNTGTATVGPIEVRAGPVTGAGEMEVPGAEVLADPSVVPTLPPGEARSVTLSVAAGSDIPVGAYTAGLRALSSEGSALAELEIRFTLACAEPSGPVASLEIDAPSGTLRQGDPVKLEVTAQGSDGAILPRPCVAWGVSPSDAGSFSEGGRFVPYLPGQWSLEARVGDAEASILVDVTPRGLPEGSFAVVGRGEVSSRFTSDLWVWEDVAYTGTWGLRSTDAGEAFGNVLHAWDISDPTDPVRTHTVEVDARTVNDVKIRDDGRIAVLTHENSSDGLNGITLLDSSDPFEPTPITRFTDGLESGVHNVWIEDDHVYLAVNGVGNGLRVLDISDPAEPQVVASFYGGESFLHDVYVRDGLAFLSHWNAGLIILDVGHGIRGGSPASPVEVGRVQTPGGRTHNAWYWPETGYVFVGEENFGNPGAMHVVDARRLDDPKVVGTYRVPDQTPHNFWVDEDRGILYAAWYGGGLRAVDVTGELQGELERQGREISGFLYADPAPAPFCIGNDEATCTWSPQLHRGDVYVSDTNRGLLVLRPDF